MWRSQSRPPAVVVWTWLEDHARGMAPVVAPPKAMPSHPGKAHFGLLKPISFIPWFRNGPIGPKGLYPNQTKPKSVHVIHTIVRALENFFA